MTEAAPATSEIAAQTAAQTAAPTGAWRRGVVRAVEHPSDHAVVLRLDVPDRIEHLPGQHYVIRLTADDGYVAQRSYSIASAPSDPLLEFYVDRLPDGEVSTFLADVVEVGDELDVRGPIGGWFVWDASTSLLGVAGGSGAVPFVAMLRHASDVGRADLLSLAVSSRTRDGLPYADEIEAAGGFVTLTGGQPPAARSARLSAELLAPLVGDQARFYVCGSAAFSGAAVTWLQQLGAPDAAIRVESFGPSG